MSNYITFEEAEGFANERLNTDAWDDAVITDGSTAGLPGSQTYKSIAMATNIIDRLNYLGQKASVLQENQFPRNTDTVIPTDIKKATFEIALSLLDGKDPEMEIDNLRIASQGYANVRSTFIKDSIPEYIVAGVPSSTAWMYLRPYLRSPYNFEIARIN